MPTANSETHHHGELVAIMSEAGSGKSTFAYQAPQPHAVLLVDKPVFAPLPAWFPDYNPSLTFGKSYPPPEADLTKPGDFPPRIVYDQLMADIQALKVALHKGDPEFKMAGETWPLPKTIIIEGMDFVRQHILNYVLNTQKKHNVDEFDNRFLPWQLVAAQMEAIFNNLTFLPSVRPVNVIVTIGLDEETKTIKNNQGKTELIKTGVIDPSFGGKMSTEAPRKFRDCWLAQRAAGKYWIVVEQDVKYQNYRGLRSGRFWPQGLVNHGLIDVTLDPAKPVNQWQRLFGGWR